MQKKSHQPKMAALFTGLLGLLLIASCSTPKSAPIYKPVPSAVVPKAAPRSALICANDEARVRVEAAKGVEVDELNRNQIAEQIQQRLDTKKGLNGTAGHDRRYEVTVTLTRYKSGSALGRLLSGKAWQVDIDSIVSIRLLPTGEKLNEFTIRENFARGGLTGLSTSYQEAALEFADGVAVALTGQATPRPVSNEWTLR